MSSAVTLEVAPKSCNCAGVIEMQCLMVREIETKQAKPQWQPWFGDIATKKSGTMTACIAASIIVCSAAGLVATYGMWGKDHRAMNQCADAGGVFNKDGVTCDKTTAENPRTTFSVYTGQVDVGVLKGKTVQLLLQVKLQK